MFLPQKRKRKRKRLSTNTTYLIIYFKFKYAFGPPCCIWYQLRSDYLVVLDYK
jgi:hypothetical protein